MILGCVLYTSYLLLALMVFLIIAVPDLVGGHPEDGDELLTVSASA